MVFHDHQVRQFMQENEQKTVLSKVGINLDCWPGAMPYTLKTPKPGAAGSRDAKKKVVFVEEGTDSHSRWLWKSRKYAFECLTPVRHTLAAGKALWHFFVSDSKGNRTCCDRLMQDNDASFSNCCMNWYNLLPEG